MLDLSADIGSRLTALRRLAEVDPERALEAAIEATRSLDATEAALAMLGAELGRVAAKYRDLTEFELRNMREAAFDAYCENLR